MPTTVMLCRWHHGWSEVENLAGTATFGRREAMLSLGAQQSIEEVVRLASAELSGLFAKHREQMTVEHRPATLAEMPYIGYIPSERIIADDFDGTPTSFVVSSMTVTEDEHGVVTFLPKVGDIILGVDEFHQALIDDMQLSRGGEKLPSRDSGFGPRVGRLPQRGQKFAGPA